MHTLLLHKEGQQRFTMCMCHTFGVTPAGVNLHSRWDRDKMTDDCKNHYHTADNSVCAEVTRLRRDYPMLSFISPVDKWPV